MDKKAIGFIIKRIFDILAGVILLIILLPIVIVLSLIIKLDTKGSVFFVQQRAGLHGKPFNIYKFRTMVENAVNMGTGYYISKDDSRITRVGKYMRDWSIDELPQIFNIIKGDMSIIGPRPTLLYQIEEYDSIQRKRLEMRPGVTGWAQINGRNKLSWPERITYDIWYIENWSLFLDLKIFFKTISVILKREGLYAEKDKFVVKDREKLG